VQGVATSSVFTTTAAHGLTVGDSIQFSVPNFVNKKLPTELVPNTYYFVLSTPSTTTFTITATRGGTIYAVADYSATTFDVETNAYRVSYTINAAKQFSFFTKSSNYNAMNSPYALTVVPNRQCGTQSTVFGNGISSAAFNTVTAFTIVARDSYGNRRTIANDGTATQDDIYLASIVYSSVPSPAPWSYSSLKSISSFSVAPVYTQGTGTTPYTVQATTVQGTGSGAVFRVSLASGTVVDVTLVVRGYGYQSSGPASVLKLFKESFGSPASGDITITVTAVLDNIPGHSAVMVTTPCASSCNNAVPTSVGDGTYTGAYTLNTMPPGAAYAGAYFRAFLAVKGGLMATFYKTEGPNPGTASPDSSYIQASTLLVTDPAYAFTCSPNCFAAARFHGFFKASGLCSDFAITSGTSSTYFQGQLKVDGWSSAAADSNVAVPCVSGQYIEFFQETRSGASAGSHSLLKWNFGSVGTANVFAAYAISNTPVPLTVTP